MAHITSTPPPPTYGNIGKTFRDLWSKKFDFKNSLKTVNKTPIGFTLTTSATFDPTTINGNFNGKYVDRTWGDVEGELDTNSGKAYATANLTKLLEGSKATIGAGLLGSKKPGDRNFLSGKGAFEHSQDFFTVNGSIVIGEEGGKEVGLVSHITAAGTIGIDGLSVGGEGKFKVDNDHAIEDHNIGAQYQTGDLTAALTTEKKGDVIRASVHYAPTRDYSIGAEFVSDELDNLPTQPLRKILNVVTQYEVDSNTTTKFRWSNSGDLGAAIEFRLRNPQLAVLFSSSFKTKGTSDFRADKFGVGLTFGDY
jgi:hypothetical protein